MNERCAIAFANPLARADETMHEQFWRGVIFQGRHPE